MATPELYSDIIKKTEDELIRFQEAGNLLELFTPTYLENNTIQKVMWRYLAHIGQASLSSALWDPTKVKHDIATLSMNRYSSGIEKELPYEDWSILLEMGVQDANLQQIVNKPNIQASYYFLQGKKLLDDNSQGDPPYPSQYNFAMDVGADSLDSTLTRPIGTNQVTGTPNTWKETTGAWSTYANMQADINELVSALVEKGFDNKASHVYLYPRNCEGAMARKRATSGDGNRNAFQEFEDLGISRNQVIAVDDIFLYTRAGAMPTRSAFDLLAIDRSAIKVYYTERPFVNVYTNKSGKKYPEMNIEAGLAYIPFFIPKYHVSDEKFYKGVSMVRAIDGT